MTTVPAPPATATAVVDPQRPPAVAVCTGTPVSRIGDGVLVSSYRDSIYKVDLRHLPGKGDPKNPYKKDQLDKLSEKVADVWEKAKDFVENTKTPRPEIVSAVSDLEINYSQLTISYRDGAGALRILDQHSISDPELRKLMEEIREISKDVWKVCHSADFDNSTLGSLSGERSFAIVTEHWNKALIQEPKQFFTDLHFGKMVTDGYLLAPADQRAAFASIIAAMEFYRSFNESVARELQNKKTQLDTLGQGAAIHARKPLLAEIEQLQELKNQLNQVKFDAVFGAIAIWGNPAENTDKVRLDKAREAARWQRHSLARLNPGEDPRNSAQRALDWVQGYRNIVPPTVKNHLGMQSYVNTYANQTGDLLLETKPEMLTRIIENGDRNMAAASIEHLIVQNAIHAADALGPTTTAHIEKTLKGLGLSFLPATTLNTAIADARAHAATKKTAAAAMISGAPTTSGWKDWLKAAKENPELQPLVGSSNDESILPIHRSAI